MKAKIGMTHEQWKQIIVGREDVVDGRGRVWKVLVKYNHDRRSVGLLIYCEGLGMEKIFFNDEGEIVDEKGCVLLEFNHEAACVVDRTGDLPAELRGNSLIGFNNVDDDPTSRYYNAPVPRLCAICYYQRTGERENCRIVLRDGQKSPHELFRIADNEPMPSKIDGYEVGYFCPYFLDVGVEDAE